MSVAVSRFPSISVILRRLLWRPQELHHGRCLPFLFRPAQVLPFSLLACLIFPSDVSFIGPFHRVGAGLLTVALVAGVGFSISWLHRALRPPNSVVCGSPFGPPLSAPRVRLPDGRHLAYKEFGVPRHSAAYKAVFVHGFNSSRHSAPPFSQAFLEAHHVYVVSFDRAGYGQSDPNPRRNLKSEAEDIERLADLLELGDTFYLIPESIGGYSGWSCLKYIPHRLAGVGMIAPVTNFWWPGISATEFKQAFATQILADRLLLRVAHYLPWLLYFWMSQPWIPASSAVNLRLEVLNASDRNVVEGFAHATEVQIAQMAEGLQQGIAETLCRDAKVMFSNWEFDPGDLENPYPDRPGCVHIWQGDEDYLVPVLLQRYIHRRLPWIQYHEIQGGGHLLKYHDGFPDSLLKTLLLGEKFEFRH